MRALGLPPRRCSACGWRGFFAQPAPSKRPQAPSAPGAPETSPVVRQATLPRLRWSLPRIIISALLFGAATGLAAWILSGEPQ